MVIRKYDYDYYLGNSTKLKNFLDSIDDKPARHRAYKLHLVRYFEKMGIKDVDNYVKDTRAMIPENKIKYLDALEKDLKNYWKQLNQEATGKTPYIWLSAIKMFLMHNKTFELDNVYSAMQKNGHGNYTVTGTKTPTREQLLKIFSYADPESKALFVFQLTSGQRIGQVVNTTFHNAGIKYDEEGKKYILPKELLRITYPTSKPKVKIKTRITPEAKKILQEYLDQRDKFIEIRKKRGEYRRKQDLDMNRLFCMNVSTANCMWTTMVKNAGLYELDPDTKKPYFGTHCLRRFFLTHFGDHEWGDFFAGHITARNIEYRQHSDNEEKLDEEYMKHIGDLNVFSTQSEDVKTLNEKMVEKDKQIDDMKKKIDDWETKYGEVLHKLLTNKK